jgi:exodeoxyribonuclease-5
MTLTEHQQQAVNYAVASLKIKENFRLGGFAGTGKTTVINHIVEELTRLGKKSYIAAPTGKAALVLKRKGLAASTIHRMMYEQVSSDPLKFDKRPSLSCDVIIIDEASMVPKDVYQDLLSYNIPILFVGDIAQLEPVGDDPKILSKCDFVLNEIHRMGDNTQLIDFVTYLRTSNGLPYQYFKSNPVLQQITNAKSLPLTFKDLKVFDQIIVGKNVTRKAINNYLKIGKTHPEPGDKLICLRNNYSLGVINGEQFIVGPKGVFLAFTESSQCFHIELLPLDLTTSTTISVPFCMEMFTETDYKPTYTDRDLAILDYGYAITCHKSQGSEWNNIIVFDEAFGNPPNRWRYTAATRAQSKLTWR